MEVRGLWRRIVEEEEEEGDPAEGPFTHPSHTAHAPDAGPVGAAGCRRGAAAAAPLHHAGRRPGPEGLGCRSQSSFLSGTERVAHP
jgi:hypothetical protein